MTAWKFESIPDQSGPTAIVTGANTGIGYETARSLSRKGARVVLACRDMQKGAAAAERIQPRGPRAAWRRRPWTCPIWTPSAASPSHSPPGTTAWICSSTTRA